MRDTVAANGWRASRVHAPRPSRRVRSLHSSSGLTKAGSLFAGPWIGHGMLALVGLLVDGRISRPSASVSRPEVKEEVI